MSAHATGDNTSLVNLAIGLAETVVGQALTLAKGPLDLVRGGPSTQERLLKNAKDECATEALEIATYDAIEALANQLDEPEIAALAARHREEEVRMLADLRALIPTLAGQADAGKTETPQPGNPIAGYDELNAGQIVARLSQLTQDQLAAVLAYERARPQPAGGGREGRRATATPPWTDMTRTRPKRSSSGSMARSRAQCATTRAATVAGWRSSKPRSGSSAAPLDRRTAQAAARLRHHASYRGGIQPPRRTVHTGGTPRRHE